MEPPSRPHDTHFKTEIRTLPEINARVLPASHYIESIFDHNKLTTQSTCNPPQLFHRRTEGQRIIKFMLTPITVLAIFSPKSAFVD